MEDVDLTLHAVIEDRVESGLYHRRIDKIISQHRTVISLHVPGDLVPPVTVSSTSPDVARHELRQFVAIKNQDARVRSLPESARRKEERTQRRRKIAESKAREQAPKCPECGGTGYSPDDDGNCRDCPRGCPVPE